LIRDLLAKDYLVNPQVSVSISEYDKRRFTVLGQVQKPGTYDMPDREAVTLLQAIGLAGGYTRIADPAKVTVKRRTEDRESVLRVDAKSMANGRSAGAFDVLPGDVITVGESIF
jgi:polysaccharide export outer membrane protein